MSKKQKTGVRKICAEHGKDRGRLMDIARAVQAQFACVDGDAMDTIAAELGTMVVGEEIDRLDSLIDQAEWEFEMIEARLEGRPVPPSPASRRPTRRPQRRLRVKPCCWSTTPGP